MMKYSILLGLILSACGGGDPIDQGLENPTYSYLTTCGNANGYFWCEKGSTGIKTPPAESYIKMLWNASNLEQIQNNRAYSYQGKVFAVGSNNFIGTLNPLSFKCKAVGSCYVNSNGVFTNSNEFIGGLNTLSSICETSEGYYVNSDCS